MAKGSLNAKGKRELAALVGEGKGEREREGRRMTWGGGFDALPHAPLDEGRIVEKAIVVVVVEARSGVAPYTIKENV